MIESAPVGHSRLTRLQLTDLSAEQRDKLLGLTRIGGVAAAWDGELPVQNVAARLLGRSSGELHEIWYSAVSCRSGETCGIRYRVDENVLYGVMDVLESDFLAKGGATPLQLASEDAYRRIFSLLEQQGYPYLWRTWNYLADINAESHGLERYRQFNIGRHDAFVDSGRLACGNVPAACALGTTDGPLTIAFMAGRTAAVPLENPRQVSAYNYPSTYGPRSPTFSRGAFAHLPGQELFFISGTASIVGHQTLHAGDVEEQTRETFRNIQALLESANRLTLSVPYLLEELNYRAYIRSAEDFHKVQCVVQELIGSSVSVLYVQADICRSDLLIEIEAMASHPMGNC